MSEESLRITVLDGYTLNPGDNSWEALSQCGELTVYDRTEPGQIVNRCRDAHIVLTNKTPLTAETLENLPQLRMISVLATGFNVVDTRAARRLGITVCNVPEYGSQTVAQYVWAGILHVTYRIDQHDAAVRTGEWQRREDFSFWLQPLNEWAGQTFGIIGWGRIGQATGRLAQAFGMNLVVYTPRPPATALPGIEFVTDCRELLNRADIVSLHCPLTPSTARMVNAQWLDCLKPSALLVNSARGGLVDEHALAAALQENRLRGAVLDVVSSEPISPDNPLLLAPNCVLTPHLAWATGAARRRLMQISVANVQRFLQGNAQNVVN